MHLIIHLLVEYFLISYPVSITEPFSVLTKSPQRTFTRHPSLFSPAGQLLNGPPGFRFAANQTGLKWAGKWIYTLLLFFFFLSLCYLQQTTHGWIKKASDLSLLLIKHRKWARIPSLCLGALSPLSPRHVNYICYQPRWWLIRYSCLLTMTSW